MDCSWADSELLANQRNVGDLPEEILEIIRHGSNTEYLNALAEAVLDPKLTETLFSYYEPIFVDISGRWMRSPQSSERAESIVTALARLLPFAPHLSIYAKELILGQNGNRLKDVLSLHGAYAGLSSAPRTQTLLLTMFRLLLFDSKTFARTISPSQLQSLLHADSRPVRYLAIRVLCLYLQAADAAMEDMIHRYIGGDTVEGEWEGKTIDYYFLSLWEEKRLDDLTKLVTMKREARHSRVQQSAITRVLVLGDLTKWTAEISGVLLPRMKGPPLRVTSMVMTSTTAQNRRDLAEALIAADPILIIGLTGSGKTAVVADLARELNVASSMVTLYLNEQTDAKLLLGMYTTTSTPGSFTWKPGVLTTAVREGRWVLIEDLDRAPTEVISVILPLIESGELLIPSRAEKVRAAQGFQIIATMRTSLNIRGEEITPGAHMLGNRLWRRVHMQMPAQDEFREIVVESFPLVRAYVPTIMNVYITIQILFRDSSFAAKSRSSLGRPISPRDLLKWCRRIQTVLLAAGAQTGWEALPEGIRDDIFMAAADCFAGSIQAEQARIAVLASIAQEMHVPPQRVQYYLHLYTPRNISTEKVLQIGRARLAKSKLASTARLTSKRNHRQPFATTGHTLRLLERIGVAVEMAEPVLLIGETGIGKTAVVQQLAESLGYKLTAVNLSQQSEAGDLLGGFKPVNIRSLAIPMKDEFNDLFEATFSLKKNQRFLDTLSKCIAKTQWKRASTLWNEALRMVEGVLGPLPSSQSSVLDLGGEQPNKRRRLETPKFMILRSRWENFAQKVKSFDKQLSNGTQAFAFEFIEGNIVKAARHGEWVLLDEINLASPDTLESLADLLYSGPGGSPSILLSETGDVERVQAHRDFRIFGAMNPATDVGKRDLPVGLRSRFTEIYVDSPDRDLGNLMSIAKAYLGSHTNADERAANDVSTLYLEAKRLADENMLVDGANQRPHFSLRTLTRTLSYVSEIAPIYGLRRALYEGFSMSFLTLLNKDSERLLLPLIDKRLLSNQRNARSLLNQTPRIPEDGKYYVQFKHYWMPKGPLDVKEQPHYIITPFIERNVLNLIRATSTRRFPILVQGPTSSGKTSMIEYIANITGNKFVRINNHEHTDLQEYLGSYVSGNDGQLYFQEGILVQALRQGHWLVLDELNLAPTDVLEALNRLLDDNRELLIPETQEIVRPQSNFMLFATQNPPGLYGGRKPLSRAFRNRFLELHFDDIPEDELETILRERSQIAPSFCTRIVTVYKRLSILRQSTRLFEQKNSFATLRDLFRWALREADNREQLAINGFMLLAERVRKPEERLAVKRIIEDVMKVSIDEDTLYDAAQSSEKLQGVVWTKAMRRLFILVSQALRNNEPVLLVGDTGCGKTMVCQMLAEAFQKTLYTVNAHQNTETSDLIGAQRPLRNKSGMEKELHQDLLNLLKRSLSLPDPPAGDIEALLQVYDRLDEEALSSVSTRLRERIQTNRVRVSALFEWSDGSLVHAMKEGQFFLLDEISLADDSVLERLNSVLEPQRTLLLAEKGPEDSFVVGSDGFQFLATMNPGGDYGKRELSPALRNRFTEIWVPSLSDSEDVLQIVSSKLTGSTSSFARPVVQFAQWFGETYNYSATSSISIRDVLAWVEFINDCHKSDSDFAMLHGCAMVFIDSLGANPAAILAISHDRLHEERQKCLSKLSELLARDLSTLYFKEVEVVINPSTLAVGAFSIPRSVVSSTDETFNLNAPTTKLNAMRVIRALQLRKPILLEGNPGVGKTTLVASLAKVVGIPLTRINLSEQTDLMDLFGSDIPLEGAEAGHFAWRDAPFLQAMQRGDWVLLDEMNLASQSVLEGLNACLDHRGQVYVSELDQTFTRHRNFAVFAAQNPHHQGGGRKGLPASFVNRFTVVYADVLEAEDLMLICKQVYPEVPSTEFAKMIAFVEALDDQVIHHRIFGAHGGPWEFNLRDILRWLCLSTSQDRLLSAGSPGDFLDMIFKQRFRNSQDRANIDQIFLDTFTQEPQARDYFNNLSRSTYQVGLAILSRGTILQAVIAPVPPVSNDRLQVMESLMICVQQGWPSIIVGASGCGKSALIKQLAAITGAQLIEFALNSDIDTMDLVGGFEQVDTKRHATPLLEDIELFVRRAISQNTGLVQPEAMSLLELLHVSTETSSDFKQIYAHLSDISKRVSSPDLPDLLQRCRIYFEQLQVPFEPRFEWVDGTLIQALEQGKWLVLDNANLCSSSVLDRLNSLLEPNGCLTVNENRTADGNVRVVKPHPSFRLFLTMDPRHGELSRAMRNRAVEIFIFPPATTEFASPLRRSYNFALESSMYRFRLMSRAYGSTTSDLPVSKELVSSSLDHISLGDAKLLQRLKSQFNAGLLNISADTEHIVSSSAERYCALLTAAGEIDQNTSQYYRDIIADTFLGVDLQDAQPIHPLVNSVLLPIHRLKQSTIDPLWLTGLQNVLLDTSATYQEFAIICKQVSTTKPSSMTRLERSMASDRIQSFKKDSTYPVFSFLVDTRNQVEQWRQNMALHTSPDRDAVAFLQEFMLFWWDLFRLVKSQGFDEGVFQVYLSLGRCMISTLLATKEGILPRAQSIESCFDSFNRHWQLSTGLSMENMWRSLKPRTASTLEQLNRLIIIENLADRLDALTWRVRLPTKELTRIRDSVADAHYAILTYGTNDVAPVANLDEAIDNLEKQVGGEDAIISPFFAAEFAGLNQYYDLARWPRPEPGAMAGLDELAKLFAGRPTKTLRSRSSDAFHGVSEYMGNNDSSRVPKALMGTLLADIMGKLNSIGEVTLKQLDLLQTELTVLGRDMSLSPVLVCGDQIDVLNSRLINVIITVVQAHAPVISRNSLESIIEELVRKESNQCIPALECRPDLPTDHYFRRMLHEYLTPCLSHLLNAKSRRADRYTEAAMAWTYLSVGSLLLYVPDRPFDPALRPFVERERHVRRKEELEGKLCATLQFEKVFTSQSSSLISRLLSKNLRALGQEPPIPGVARPIVSEITQLQGDFTNLLKSVVKASPEQSLIPLLLTGDASARQQAELLRANIRRIKQRLAEGYRAYRDVTVPVIGMLDCLDVGLTLAFVGTSNSDDSTDLVAYLCDRTLFLGGRPKEILQYTIDGSLPTSSRWFDLQFHYLESLIIVRGIDGISSTRHTERESMSRIFHECYIDWKEQLSNDQEKAAAKSGLYRYRGTQEEAEEVDEEELKELFPSYDESAEKTRSSQTTPMTNPKELAIKLAKLHAALFTNQNSITVRLHALLEKSAAAVGKLSQKGLSKSSDLIEKLFPAVLISLNRTEENLQSSNAVDNTYNFYVDPNLGEVRKLITFIHPIQHRFVELRKAWPEHAILQNVLITCEELLAFRHIEPIAKILTKVEKLHAYIHEWQVVASREFSAAALYDQLTSTLVSWRRLELSTWARLFDAEKSKCDEDTNSWWFVAYEVIVAVPLSLLDSNEDMGKHAQQLLATLETFLSTTSMGQFSQRLRLLEQLKDHLHLLTNDLPQLTVIANALHNFLSYYTRFEQPIIQSLTKGRSVLEKEMKEVILLASWKDININALRESARRSHHKLFNLVRKYRALLAQPIDLQKMGMPTSAFDTCRRSFEVDPPTLAVVDEEALKLCQGSHPDWVMRPARFQNPTSTLTTMVRISQLSASVVNGAAYLESFTSNLLESIADLQKQTPSVLTAENKEMVKHLKSRKRKLFSDTLKELRHMGFKSNLGANALAKQESTSTILAATPPLLSTSGSTTEDAELYLHKTLEVMPKVREGTREHSDDLTGPDVSRCAGYSEGLLFAVLKQRDTLLSSMASLDMLKATTQTMDGLWSPREYRIKLANEDSSTQGEYLRRLISWLPHILDFSRNIIRTHSKLGEISSEDVMDSLHLWRSKCEGMVVRYNQLPQIPVGITTTLHTSLYEEAKVGLQELRAILMKWIEERPLLAFALKQILPWTEDTHTAQNGILNVSGTFEITELDQRLLKMYDSILVVLQDLREPIASMPSSTEDTACMTTADSGLSEYLKALRTDKISLILVDIMSKLRFLHTNGETETTTAGALCSMALPVVQQYQSICEVAVDRYAKFHRSCCKMVFVLANSFTQIASQGFCTPAEKSVAEDGKTENLEGGTGLGEGDGAEDISKDIQDDEDLSELAQEPDSKSHKEDIEDEQDAVDMQQEEMKGEMGEAPGKEEENGDRSDEEDGQDEIDEEAGGVDDLDPSAVDEKLWDGDGEKAEKDKEGDQSKGLKSKEEQAAAQEVQGTEEGEMDDGEEETGAQEEEEAGREETEKADPHVKEGDALDLPEEMDLDGDNQSSAGSDIDDDKMDELSNIDQDGVEEEQAEDDVDGDGGKGQENNEMLEQELEIDPDALDSEDENEEGTKREEVDPTQQDDEDTLDENQRDLLRDHLEDVAADANDAAPSDVIGTGDEQYQGEDSENISSSKAQGKEGANRESSAPDQQEAAAPDDKLQSEKRPEVGQSQDENPQESGESQAFKKLGDALERWHRQQRQIREASGQEEKERPQPMETDGADANFEHLPDDDAAADSQALGAATEDQAHALDESEALYDDIKQLPQDFLQDEEEAQQEFNRDTEMQDSGLPDMDDAPDEQQYRAGAVVGQANDPNRRPLQSENEKREDQDDLDDVDKQLSTIHIDPISQNAPRSPEEARRIWSHYENLTRDLSLSLTEQLRLILAPILATKMRGDFRTGKRLNIKRIIPYIASQYKRDKIWMRRSVPSKRSYQIMLAVDDSKSMGENSSGQLAFETLALVSKSLSMLEVGEICVVGFGDEVSVAHAFDKPFSSEAGVQVFQQFGFGQTKTDVRKLIAESVNLFREARNKSSNTNTELWQFELIISDGVYEDHEMIRRLVRQAQEERIMIVFVIVDAIQGDSIMDMKEATFEADAEGNMKPRIHRYLDGFPFGYYLVVSDVRELPSVLATALRQWFAEVVDASG
ncbi:MAG: hypothetical protein M1827_002643 [Pycnora praestabilis]|nr:MAG: hypothetical protein M1827_002643 [Pycnora praestabilis]